MRQCTNFSNNHHTLNQYHVTNHNTKAKDLTIPTKKTVLGIQQKDDPHAMVSQHKRNTAQRCSTSITSTQPAFRLHEVSH